MIVLVLKITMLTMMAVGLVSCDQGGKVSELVKVTLDVRVVSGENQVLPPDYLMDQEIVFGFKDEIGNPLVDSEVSYRLLDTTGVSGLTLAHVKDAVERDAHSLALKGAELVSDRFSDPEKSLGKLLQASVKTDAQGFARARITTPKKFNRRITIVALAGKSGDPFFSLNFAHLSTSRFGASETLVLTTTNLLDEFSGKPFEIRVSVQNQGKVVEYVTDDEFTLRFTSFPDKDQVSEFPEGEIKCLFEAGRCVVPGGPFHVFGAGNLRFSVEMLGEKIPLYQDTLKVSQSSPDQIALSTDSLDEQTKDECPELKTKNDPDNPCLIFSADRDKVILRSFMADATGQMVNQEAVTWEVTGPLNAEENSQSKDRKPEAEFALFKIGKGTIKISHSDLEFEKIYSYEILPGKPSYYTVQSENFNKESAVEHFSGQVVLYDRKDNICVNYNGSFELHLTLEGANKSPVPIEKVPEADFTEVVKFENGIGNSSKTFLAPNGKDLIQIKVSGDLGVALSDKVTMRPGPVVSADFRSQASGLGDILSGTMQMKPDESFIFYLSGTDKYGNFSEPVPASWSTKEFAPDQLVLRVEGDESLVNAAARFGGDGILVATPKNKELPEHSIKISIESGRPVSLQLETPLNFAEEAGVEFPIKVIARDVRGKISTTFNETLPLIFEYTDPGLSWTGKSSTLPTGSVSCVFKEGICEVPNPDGKSGYIINNSEKVVILTVKDSSGTIGNPSLVDEANAFRFTTKKGAASDVVFADKQGGPVEGAVTLKTSKFYMSTDDILLLTPAFVDKGGNFLSNATVSWSSGLSKITDYFTHPGGDTTILKYEPLKIVDEADMGEIVATVPGIASPIKVQVVVRTGMPSKLSFNVPGGTAMTAGDCRSPTATVQDRGDNIIKDLPPDIYIGIAIGSTTAPVTNPYSIVSWGSGYSSPQVTNRFLDGFFLPPNEVVGSEANSLLDAVNFCAPTGNCSGKYYTTNIFTNLAGDYASVNWIKSGKFLTTVEMDGVIKLPNVCLANTGITPSLYVQVPEVKVDWGPEYGGEVTYAEMIDSQAFSLTIGSAHHLSFHRESTTTPGTSGNRYCHDSYLISIMGNKFPNDHVYGRCFGGHFDGPTVDSDDPIVIYANVNDPGSNYLRAASGTWSLSPMASGTTIVEQTSSYIKIKTTNASVNYSLTFTDTVSGISDTMQFYVLPGVPAKFSASVEGSSLATQAFDLQVVIRDQYNNNYTLIPYASSSTGSGTCHSRYGSSWAINLSSDALASPKGTAPTGLSSIMVGAICGQYKGIYTTEGTPFYYPKASTPTTISLNIPQLPASGQNYSLLLNRKVGPLLEVGSFLANDFLGAKMPDNWLLTTDADNTKVYLLGRDAEQNQGINNNANVLIAGKLTEAVDQYVVEDGLLVISPSILGDSTITVDQGGAFPDDVTNLTVTEGTLNYFEFSVDGIPDNILTAGTQVSLSMSAFDKDGNKKTSFTGSKFLQVSSNITANPENNTFTGLSTGNFTFSSGDLATPLLFTPLAASNSGKITITHIDGSPVSSVYSFVVNATGFHHYGVVSDSVYYPTKDFQNTFSSTIYMRDAWGNNLTGGPADAVSLSLLRTDNTNAPGTVQGTTTGISLSGGSATVSDLKYDGVGLYKIKATGSGLAADLTDSPVLSVIDMKPSVAAIKDLNLAVQGNPANLKTGQPFNIIVTAADNHGNAVAADTELNALTVNWAGLSSSLDATDPHYAPSGPFSGGIRTFMVTPVAPEQVPVDQLVLTALDGVTPVFTGKNKVLLDIKAGTVAKYVITTSKSVMTADSDAGTGLFDVTIKCLDLYDNLCAGEGGLTLGVQWVSGSAVTPGSVQGLPGSPGDPLNLSSGELTLTGVHYKIAHQMKLILLGTAATVESSTLTFTPTVNTIASYKLDMPDSSVGLNQATATVSALDSSGNVIEHADIDTLLNGYTFCWYGFLNSPSPSSASPVLDQSASFSNGVGLFTHSLYRSKVVLLNEITVKDNFGGSCASGRSGLNIASFTVNAGAITKYAADDLFQLNQVAGVAFLLDIAAKDNWDNTITNYADESLTLSWSGTTPSLRLGENPVTDADGLKDFQNGVWRSSSAFKLFNTGDPNPKLVVTGATSGVSTEISNFNLQASSTVDAIVITSQNINYTWGLGALVNHTMTVDDVLSLYALGYDAWGNVIGLTSVNWSSTEANLANNFSASSGSQITLNPVLSTTGTIDATHVATGKTDATGTITVNPGGLNQFKVEPQIASPVSAGAPFNVIVTAQDSQGNTVVGFTGSKAGVFSWNNANSSPDAHAPTVQVANCNFVSGVCNSSADFKLYKHGDSGVTLTYTSEGKNGTSVSPLSVNHAALASLVVESQGGYAVTANDAFTFKVSAKDAWGNLTVGISDLDLTFVWENTSATISGNGTYHALNPEFEASGSKNFGIDGDYITTNGFKLLNAYDDDSGSKPRLRVSSTTPAITGYSQDFTIAALAAVDYLKVHKNGVTPGPGGVGTELNTLTINADQNLTLRSYGYDKFGNSLGLQLANWTATGDHTADLITSPTNSNSVVLPGAALAGTGLVTAKLVSSPAIEDSTGLLTIEPGVEAFYSVAFTTASPVSAGEGIGATVTALDQYGQVLNTLNSLRTNASAFTWLGATASPGGTQPATPGSCNFVNGVCTITSGSGSLALYNGADSGVNLKYTWDGKTGQTTVGALTVDYKDEISNFLVEAVGSTTVTADVGFNVKITARDAWNNVIAKNQAVPLTYTWKNTTATSVGAVNPVTDPAVGPFNFVNGVYLTTGNAFKLYNVSDSQSSPKPVLEVKKTSAAIVGDSPDYTIQASATVSSLAVVKDLGAGNTQEITTHTMNASETFTVKAEGRDPWGNSNGFVIANWTATGDHTGQLSPASNSTTTELSASIGKGKIKAVLASDASIFDETEDISATPGPFALTGDFSQNNFVLQSGTPSLSWGASAGNPLFDVKVVEAPGCVGGTAVYTSNGLASATPEGTANSLVIPVGNKLPDGGPYYLCVTAKGVNGSGDITQTNDPHPAFYVESSSVHLLTRSVSGGGTHHIDYYQGNFDILSDTELETVESLDNSVNWFLDSIGLSLDSNNIAHISYAKHNGAAFSLVYGHRTGGSFAAQLTDLYTGAGSYLAPVAGDEIGHRNSIVVDHNNADKVYISHKNHRVTVAPTDNLSVQIDEGAGTALTSVESMDRIATYDTDLDVFDTSLAIDSLGNQHVVWVVKDINDLGKYKLMYQKSGNASEEISSGQCLDVLKADIAIDGNDQAHVAYVCKNKFSSSTCTLAYKKQTGGVWDAGTETSVFDVVPSASGCTLATVAEGADTYKPSIVTDSNHCPHISSVYLSGANMHVGYSKQSFSGTCQAFSAVVNPLGARGSHTRVTLDEYNYAYIAAIKDDASLSAFVLSNNPAPGGSWTLNGSDSYLGGLIKAIGDVRISGTRGRNNYVTP